MTTHPRGVRIPILLICLLHGIAVFHCALAILIFGGTGAAVNIWSIAPWVVAPFSSFAIISTAGFLAGRAWARQPVVAALAIGIAPMLALPYAAGQFFAMAAATGSSSGGTFPLTPGAAMFLVVFIGAVGFLFLGVLPALSAWVLYALRRKPSAAS